VAEAKTTVMAFYSEEDDTEIVNQLVAKDLAGRGADPIRYDTIDSALGRLEEIEQELAQRYGLTGNIREQLIEMNKRHEILETDIVANWHQALSWYYGFLEDAHGH